MNQNKGTINNQGCVFTKYICKNDTKYYNSIQPEALKKHN